ncbi:MAG: hypothetical protein LBB48_02045 [Treponema sp.]|jgi:hypothetical protein|nr:hypothetical protein [Treponema sp.]
MLLKQTPCRKIIKAKKKGAGIVPGTNLRFPSCGVQRGDDADDFEARVLRKDAGGFSSAWLRRGA